MTQIIFDMENVAMALPESQKDGYHIARVPLSVDVQMISGRMVREVRGFVYEVSYQYGYFNEEDKNKLIESCERGAVSPIRCAVLAPNNVDLITSNFFVTGFTYPKFFWSRKVNADGTETDVPMWGDFSFTLREVEPRD